MIHRDIKPSNIWLEEETGRVKILDFGLSRVTDGGEQLTHSGSLLGTPACISPEQASGIEADARSDLFSLGCVLYRCATGRRPFTGRDTLSTLVAVTTTEPPPPRELNPALPGDLNDLIVALLVKDRDQRLQTAREVAERLEAVGHEVPYGPRAVPAAGTAILPLPEGEGTRKPPRRRGLVMLCAAAAAALIAGIIITIKNEKGETIATIKSTGPVEVDAAPGHTVTASVGNGLRSVPDELGNPNAKESSQPRALPAGERETRRAQRRNGTESVPYSPQPPTPNSQPLPPISAMSLVTEPTPIPGAKSWTLETIDHRGDIHKMEFNTDGTLLATYGEDGAVRLWNAETGELARIFVGGDSPSGGIAWSPDGTSIAVAAGGKIKAWQAASGKTVCNIALIDGEAASLAWSPDGKTFAVGQRPIGQPEARARHLCLYDVASGKRRSDRHHDDWRVERIAWSPDGKRLLHVGRFWRCELLDLDNDGAHHVGSRSAAEDIPLDWNFDRDVAWTAEGVPLVAGIAEVEKKLVAQLWQAEPAKLLKTFAVDFEGEQSVWTTLSADGRFVAVGCKDAGKGFTSERAAYVYETATGKAVAHFDRSAGHPGPWVFPKEETPISLWEYEPRYAISRDGKLLARCGKHLGGPDFFNVTSGDPHRNHRQITDYWRLYSADFCAAWSPDGRTLAARGEDGAVRYWDAADIWPQATGPAALRGFPGISPFGASDLRWTPDGRSLRVACNTSHLETQLAATAQVTARRDNFQALPNYAYSPAFSSDAQRYAGRVHDRFRVGIFDLDVPAPRKVLDAITDDTVTWSPDGGRVSARHGNATEIWDIEANECVWRSDGGKASLVWSPAGSRFVLSGNGEATIHDAASGNVLHELDEPPAGSSAWPRLSWSPDGRHLAGRGRIWDAETGEVVARLPGAAVAGETGAPAWSSDGSTLAYLGPGRAVAIVGWALPPLSR